MNFIIVRKLTFFTAYNKYEVWTKFIFQIVKAFNAWNISQLSLTEKAYMTHHNLIIALHFLKVWFGFTDLGRKLLKTSTQQFL